MNFGKLDHPCACLIVGSVREAGDGLFCGGGQAHESPDFVLAMPISLSRLYLSIGG